MKQEKQSYGPIIYKNFKANQGYTPKGGTPIIHFQRFRFPYTTKVQREMIREFIKLYKLDEGKVETTLQNGRGHWLGIPPYILKCILP